MAKHWLLDARTGWCTGTAEDVAVGARLTLAAVPSGPLGFAAADGSLGGLRLPTGIALSRKGVCYLLDPAGAIVRRFDGKRFVPVLSARPPEDSSAFGSVANLAIAGDLLYLADRRDGRVLAFGVPDLRLRHVWAGYHDLADVTSDGEAAYFLDRHESRVWRHRPGRDHPELVVRDVVRSGRMSAVAVDTAGLVHLYDPAYERLRGYSRFGRPSTEYSDPGEVRDRFRTVPIRVLQGVFVLPDGQAFDRSGHPREKPRASRGPAPYVRAGQWTSTVLDSRVYHCVWDRIELDVADLPAGTALALDTATFDEPPTEESDVDWTTAGRQAGTEHAPGVAASRTLDWPVRSPQGRYLALRLRLSGPGRATPAVTGVRARYPRESALEFLPSIFAADAEGKDFLERFLGVFQAEWDHLAARVAELPAYADPDAVPAGAPLEFLAGWLGIPLDERWDVEAQRRWLRASLAVLRRRGTPKAVRELLAALAANLSGVEPRPDGLPRLVEGFRTRNRQSVGGPRWGEVDARAPLWSPDVVGRLRTPSYARVGKAKLVSTSDPSHDVFTSSANSFRVYLPSSWVRTAEDERVVRRLLAAERPATTRYQLCLVEPRLRVATQSTVGLDTVVGGVPVARLACPHEETVPPSRPPRHRLGMDTVLAARPRPRAVTVIRPSE
ncbi:phage tail protein [Amycolatopsis samaneae]|uniref:Phage tail protein n=1 Tax=Amycolatopsis samaneae TaxID=664691 RepID=A0ABW5GFJ9_9PSEU